MKDPSWILEMGLSTQGWKVLPGAVSGALGDYSVAVLSLEKLVTMK